MGGVCGGGHAWEGGMHDGEGAYVTGGMCGGGHAWWGEHVWQGACMTGGHAWQERQSLQRAVRTLLECILV